MTATVQELINDHFPAGFLGDKSLAMEARSAKIADHVTHFLHAMNANGYLKANSHAQGRKIGWVSAWNSFVSGQDLDAFAQMRMQYTPAHVAAQRASQTRFIDLSNPRHRGPLTAADAEAQIRAVMLGTLPFVNMHMGSDLFDCPMTGEILAKDFRSLYDPVILNAAQEPCHPVTPPKPVRHVVMPMPSGKLVMADWIDVPGMKAMMQRSEPADDDFAPDINSAAGRDLDTQRIFEDLGILLIHLANAPGDAYIDGSTICMGSVRSGNDKLKSDWTFDADARSNMFADRQTVLDVMMASGEYGSRETAETKLDNSNAMTVDIGPGDLHVYMPTGAHGSLHNTFSKDAIGVSDQLIAKYVMTRTPAVAVTDLVDDPQWTAGAPNRPIDKGEAPSP